MEREAYADWIRHVRGTMSQEEFAQKLCRVQSKGGNKRSTRYHRNQVGNWEKGKNLQQVNIETMISIALLDFGQSCPGGEEDMADYGQRRLQFVQEKLEQFLGVRLYCRNVHDVLLIQVCRNIISMEEVQKLEPELEEIVRGAAEDMDLGEKRKLALQRETVNISRDVYRVRTKEEIREIVSSAKHFFYTGIRTFGERMQQCYEKRQRYAAPVSFAEAVRIFAPNYRNSVNRIFVSNAMSREWIVDLCVHLRFNRKEIQEMLANAHLVGLSSDPQDEEYYLVERMVGQKEMSIGSVCWYRYIEEHYSDVYPGHFSELRLLELPGKFALLFLISAFLDNVNEPGDLVPADYLLESFVLYDHGRPLLEAVQNLALLERQRAESDTEPERTHDERIRELGQGMETWLEYLGSAREKVKSGNGQSVYREYCREFMDYGKFPAAERAGLSGRMEVIRLHYLAALTYTVFTGKYYRGKITEEDLQEIKEPFKQNKGEWKTLHHFINQFLLTFAGGYPLFQDIYGHYYCKIGKKRMMSMDSKEVAEDIWEALQALLLF